MQTRAEPCRLGLDIVGLNHLQASWVTCIAAVQGSHGYNVPVKWPEDFGENWLHGHALMACVVFV